MLFEKNPSAVYFAKSEFIETLCNELGNDCQIVEGLVFSSKANTEVAFALDIWLKPQLISFNSISEAVKILRKAGAFWYLHPVNQIRRSRLIEAQLRKCPPLLQNFPVNKPLPPMGGFCLLDNNTLLYSSKRLKKWPGGICQFIEDKINPPNRAYLKLWEALSLLDQYPTAAETVLDLGASPGGWTYVMQSLGASVTSVDKAPLDAKIAQLPRIEYLQESAFAIDPHQITSHFDWILSDVACYPDRAYSLIMKWIESGLPFKQMIITIKLQGEIDMALIQKFQAIPHSYLTNLYYNKHEVTFFYPHPIAVSTQ